MQYVRGEGGTIPGALQTAVETIARTGGTPLAVARNGRAIGVVHLKDVVKPGMKERFRQMRAMGIKTVMITGDNPLTATAIAAEAGVDDFLAEATPEAKLKLIRQYQAEGRLVAMTGDGTNDAPGPGPGRCRRGDEQRYAARPRGSQHGRPGQRPDQAD
jgi:K+-transporting ATPase ATPase B chain